MHGGGGRIPWWFAVMVALVWGWLSLLPVP